MTFGIPMSSTSDAHLAIAPSELSEAVDAGMRAFWESAGDYLRAHGFRGGDLSPEADSRFEDAAYRVIWDWLALAEVTRERRAFQGWESA